MAKRKDLAYVAEEQLIYAGKAKKLYGTTDNEVLRVVYLDQATALNGLRKDQIEGKGALNNQITSLIFNYLSAAEIQNHFIEKTEKHEQLVKRVQMIPLEVVIRNIATGSFVKKYHGEEGKVFTQPVLEFYYKNDELADPLINEAQIEALELATAEQLAAIKTEVLRLNQALQTLFAEIDLTLVDFKVEYGVTAAGEVLLADEITPDTCRLWEKTTGASFDKDVYRKETGDLRVVYHEVLARLTNLLAQPS